MITLRAAVEDDIARIQEIEQESISPPWSHGGLLVEIFRDDSFFSLAVEEDTILGFIILRHTADEGELFQIAVENVYRRRGVGALLMSAALNWAQIRGINAIYLEVRKSNETAIRLYKAHGFRKTGLRKEYYAAPVEDAIVMTRRNASF